MVQRWLILGAGGHGRSVAIAANGGQLVGFLDDGHPAVRSCIARLCSEPCRLPGGSGLPESSDSSAKTGLLAPELARKALSTLTFDSTDSSPNCLTHRLSGNPAWGLNRLFVASDQAPADQVVVAIGNPALRQTWQQLLER
jgi:hypothetical protein